MNLQEVGPKWRNNNPSDSDKIYRNVFERQSNHNEVAVQRAMDLQKVRPQRQRKKSRRAQACALSPKDDAVTKATSLSQQRISEWYACNGIVSSRTKFVQASTILSKGDITKLVKILHEVHWSKKLDVQSLSRFPWWIKRCFKMNGKSIKRVQAPAMTWKVRCRPEWEKPHRGTTRWLKDIQSMTRRPLKGTRHRHYATDGAGDGYNSTQCHYKNDDTLRRLTFQKNHTTKNIPTNGFRRMIDGSHAHMVVASI